MNVVEEGSRGVECLSIITETIDALFWLAA